MLWGSLASISLENVLGQVRDTVRTLVYHGDQITEPSNADEVLAQSPPELNEHHLRDGLHYTPR